MVMAGASDDRHQVGAQLVKEGVSQNFVVSNPDGILDKVGSAYCRGSNRPEEATGIWCLRPDPITTVGEAMTVRELAAEEGWSTMIAITNRPHVRRVDTILKECTTLDVVVIPIDNVRWKYIPNHVAREIAGYLKFWLTRPC